jgi:hypothetical protein
VTETLLCPSRAWIGPHRVQGAPTASCIEMTEPSQLAKETARPKGHATRRSTDVPAPRMPYGQAMQSSASEWPAAPGLPARTPCNLCGHAEFVHGDSETRHCCYSECDCIGFTAPADRVDAPPVRGLPR